MILKCTVKNRLIVAEFDRHIQSGDIRPELDENLKYNIMSRITFS